MSAWQSWLTALQAQGYTVTQGTAATFNAAYCQQTVFTVFKTCFNSDAEDPYLVALPPVGNGYVDPYYGAATSQTLPDGTVAGQIYQLDPTEAVLVVVNLPPTAAYMSYQTYVFTRPTADYPNPVKKLSPDPSRALIFGSFSNSTNNVLIGQQSGLGFGQGTIGLLTTANAALAATLTASFANSGGDPTTMFIDPVGSLTSPGLTDANDDFESVLRYSVPSDVAAADSWRDSAAANMLVYRIDPPPGGTVQLFGATPIANRAYNANESGHKANLSELSQLLQGWLAGQEPGVHVGTYRAISGEKVSSAGVPLSGELGPYCIQNGTDCAGDSQDTDTYKTVNIGKLPAGQMFIATGVDHTVTTNATFVSLGIEDQKTGTGAVNASQTNAAATGFSCGSLTGSAAAALQTLGLYNQASPSLIKDLPNLYVQIFARSCSPGQAWCGASFTTLFTAAEIPVTDTVQFTERAYVLPGFLNGANPTDLLNPNVVH